jgi:hypothetical protein
MNGRFASSALVAALLMMSGTVIAENNIDVVREQGRPVAQFKLGDSQCTLRDGQIRCTPLDR